MRSLIFFLAMFLLQGCGLKAPDVKFPDSAVRFSKENAEAENANCTDPEKWCLVTYSLKLEEGIPILVYWTAGTKEILPNASKDFIASKNWDMRLTRYFPMIGTNGGETAKNTGSTDAIAAMAAAEDVNSRFIPSQFEEISDWKFISDTFESIDPSLPAGYQNMLVNKIGTGILKSYNIPTHAVELSHRPFVLRSADGLRYYVLQFDFYSATDKVFGFRWKKLKGN